MEICSCPARAKVDVQAGSSQNVPNSRLISVCQCSPCYSYSALMKKLTSWTFCFLHLLLVAGDEESTVRSFLSDEVLCVWAIGLWHQTKSSASQTQRRFFLQVLGNKLDWHTITLAVNEASPGTWTVCHSLEGLGVCLACPASGSPISWNNSDIHTIYIPSRSLPQVNMA